MQEHKRCLVNTAEKDSIAPETKLVEIILRFYEIDLRLSLRESEPFQLSKITIDFLGTLTILLGKPFKLLKKVTGRFIPFIIAIIYDAEHRLTNLNNMIAF